jgi:hypothetical protein
MKKMGKGVCGVNLSKEDIKVLDVLTKELGLRKRTEALRFAAKDTLRRLKLRKEE